MVKRYLRLSARHWQQIEKGRPITVNPPPYLSIFGISVERLVRGSVEEFKKLGSSVPTNLLVVFPSRAGYKSAT